MNIKYKNYMLKQSGDRFDLYETVTRTKKETKENYLAEKDIGYGFTLNNPIKRMIMEELSKNTNTVTLESFLQAYKKEKGDIDKTLSLCLIEKRF